MPKGNRESKREMQKASKAGSRQPGAGLLGLMVGRGMSRKKKGKGKGKKRKGY